LIAIDSAAPKRSAAHWWIRRINPIEQTMRRTHLRTPSQISGALARLGLALGLGAALATQALAQDVSERPKPSFTAPLPPPRPLDLDGDRANVAAPASPTLAAPTAPTTVPAASATTTPQILPPASRERMHACGLEWQKMKIAGDAKDKTWLDFAQTCLAQ
jgi:hypothetical protein